MNSIILIWKVSGDSFMTQIKKIQMIMMLLDGIKILKITLPF
jgi:hypothetical protein